MSFIYTEDSKLWLILSSWIQISGSGNCSIYCNNLVLVRPYISSALYLMYDSMQVAVSPLSNLSDLTCATAAVAAAWHMDSWTKRIWNSSRCQERPNGFQREVVRVSSSSLIDSETVFIAAHTAQAAWSIWEDLVGQRAVWAVKKKYNLIRKCLWPF